MERTIKVTGKGKISVKPDLIQLNINAGEVYQDYSEAVKRSAEETEIVREALTRAGLDPKELKTVSFGIDTEYEGYQDEQGIWRQKFAGYRYHHSTYIRFPNDKEILGKVLYELARCTAKVEFNIGYTVKDTDAAKNSLLAKAVADSRVKAEILCEAAGVKPGEIMNIDYSWGEMEIYTQPLNRMKAGGFGTMADMAEESLDISIEAEDINVQDTVTVVWEIK